jgi:hypothetical protein
MTRCCLAPCSHTLPQKIGHRPIWTRAGVPAENLGVDNGTVSPCRGLEEDYRSRTAAEGEAHVIKLHGRAFGAFAGAHMEQHVFISCRQRARGCGSCRGDDSQRFIDSPLGGRCYRLKGILIDLPAVVDPGCQDRPSRAGWLAHIRSLQFVAGRNAFRASRSPSTGRSLVDHPTLPLDPELAASIKTRASAVDADDCTFTGINTASASTVAPSSVVAVCSAGHGRCHVGHKKNAQKAATERNFGIMSPPSPGPARAGGGRSIKVSELLSLLLPQQSVEREGREQAGAMAIEMIRLRKPSLRMTSDAP